MAKKRRKSSSKFFIILFVLFVICVVALFIVKPEVFKSITNLFNKKDNQTTINSDDLTIHFLELGVKNTGDSIYIKAGDTDILIDAGSTKESASTITKYLNQYVTDGKLEYVIATHGDKDHISAFVGPKGESGVLDSFKVDTIIDFPRTTKTTTIYKDYVAKRENLVKQGTKHFTALECFNNENGAKRVYELSKGIELEILYNKFYEENTTDENNNSVCLMINQGSRHFLFTGDLEKEGEDALVKNNKLPEVELFKAGHHGSKTSSNDALLSVIKPKIVCVCCCAGSDEYTKIDDNMFPTQAFISRVCKYTDKVYVTSLATEDQSSFTSMNGNIVVTSKKDQAVMVNCSNNNTILKDTEWFKKHRKWE